MLPLSPGLPSSPGRPGSPGSPTSPTGPSGPCSPVGPIGPWGPWGPRSPLFPPLPAGPCTPDSPGKPYNRKISLNYMSQVTCRRVHHDVSVVIKIELKLQFAHYYSQTVGPYQFSKTGITLGSFLSNPNIRKFQLEIKWNGLCRFIHTGNLRVVHFNWSGQFISSSLPIW